MKIEPFPGVLTLQVVERPYATKTGRKGIQHVKAWVLTDEQRAWLCRWFPEEQNSRLAAASGMSYSTLHRFALQLGLTKSPEGMNRIKHRQAQHVKRVCEKNGWYDSLRGHRPSEACLQGVSKMWQDIREGKREHPARVMQRENPRKYKKLMQRKGEVRREAVRKERRRVLYGLERKTRLRLVMCKYTRSQSSHRYNALRRGYIIMEDCSEQSGERYNIYYDNDTKRSPRFEQNLIKDGFHLKEWKGE